MCGRYALFSNNKVFSKFGVNITPNYNISPNQNILVIDENLAPKLMNWGLKPEWMKKSIINARNETLFDKKIFSNLKRCTFIADGYYEWKNTCSGKIPFFHYLKNDFLFFAGIYDETGCCIVTKESCKYLSSIHNRQPYFLREKQIKSWINNANQKLTFDNFILFHPVSSRVNRVWKNRPDLILEDKECIIKSTLNSH